MVMRESAQNDPRPHVSFPHAQVLGVLHVLFSTANGLGLGAMIAMYGFLLLRPLRNPTENAGNLKGLMILLVVLPFAVIFPMLGGFGLLYEKGWAARLIGFCSPLALLLVLAITIVWVWELQEPIALTYGIPFLLMSVYAAWYAWRKRAG
jgi:hypothetical protein